MREVPADPHGLLLQEERRFEAWPEPEDDFQALMEAPPFVEPARTKSAHVLDAADLTGVMVLALSGLSDIQRYVVQASVIERVSIRALGKRLGMSKSSVHRIRTQALAALRVELADEPVILAYLKDDDE